MPISDPTYPSGPCLRGPLLALVLGAGFLSSCYAQPGWTEYQHPDGHGNTIVEARSHHPGRAPTVAMYAVDKDGKIEPLYGYEASSFFGWVFSLVGAAAP